MLQVITVGLAALSDCTDLSGPEFGNRSVTCTLPPGVGRHVLVVAANALKTSAPLPLVSYAAPEVTQIDHPQCQGVSAVQLSGCPRQVASCSR